MIELAHLTKYSNIFVRNLRIFEYIHDLTFWCFEYSNIFVSQFFYIRIRILNIRPKIFEYSNIFEYSLCSGTNELRFCQPEPDTEFLKLNSVEPEPNTEFWNLNSVKPEPNTEFWNLYSVEPEPNTELWNLNSV